MNECDVSDRLQNLSKMVAEIVGRVATADVET